MATRSWLRLDALNRAWRTLAQGVVLAAVTGAAAGVYPVVQAALRGQAAGEVIEWARVWDTALRVGWPAAGLAVVAYLWRRYLDPSRVPSAAPPLPPGVAPADAPATRPVR